MTTARSIYTLRRDWNRDEYEVLLRAAVAFCPSFMLVVRSDLAELAEEGHRVLNKLRPCLLTCYQSTSWPGTKLLTGLGAYVSKWILDDVSAEILRTAVDTLWDWLMPRYPEDLSFLRVDGRPLFASISHEREAYFQLSADEVAAVEHFFGSQSLQCEGPELETSVNP